MGSGSSNNGGANKAQGNYQKDTSKNKEYSQKELREKINNLVAKQENQLVKGEKFESIQLLQILRDAEIKLMIQASKKRIINEIQASKRKIRGTKNALLTKQMNELFKGEAFDRLLSELQILEDAERELMIQEAKKYSKEELRERKNALVAEQKNIAEGETFDSIQSELQILRDAERELIIQEAKEYCKKELREAKEYSKKKTKLLEKIKALVAKWRNQLVEDEKFDSIPSELQILQDEKFDSIPSELQILQDAERELKEDAERKLKEESTEYRMRSKPREAKKYSKEELRERKNALVAEQKNIAEGETFDSIQSELQILRDAERELIIQEAKEYCKKKLREAKEYSKKKLLEKIKALVPKRRNQLVKDEKSDSIPSELQILQESTEYRMRSKPRGVCLIINNVKFNDDEKYRAGSDKDEEQLRKVFGIYLEFKVDVLFNATDEQMNNCLDMYARENHKSYDCFVCCILSHGDKEQVCGVNDKHVSLRQLQSHFTASNCKTLAGKPKLFFIQTCQGTELMKGVSIEKDSSCAVKKEPKQTEMIPDEADFFTGFATTFGHASIRIPTKGTLYIQALCDVFRRNASYGLYTSDGCCEVQSMMTEVSRKVSETDIEGEYKQMPAVFHQLRKLICFR